MSTASLQTLPSVHVPPLQGSAVVLPACSSGVILGEFRADMLSPSSRPTSATAMPLQDNRAHWRCAAPPFLVPGTAPQTSNRLIETELSHDVLNSSSRTALPANSPTLGTRASPWMRRADIEVPNLAVVNSGQDKPVGPWGSFIQQAHPFHRVLRITLPWFPPARDVPLQSAPLLPMCLYVISIHPEGLWAPVTF